MKFPFPAPPAEPPRVVVTGAGIVTALGLGWKANAEGFRAGRTAFRPVTLFDVSRHRVKTAAQVELPSGASGTASASPDPRVNIQHSTFNIQHSMTGQTGNVGGSMFSSVSAARGLSTDFHLTPRQLTRLDRASLFLLLAASEAWQQAGWERSDPLPVVLGTTSGGMLLGEDYFRQAVRTPRRHRGQPTRAFHYQAQTQGRLLLDALGIDGPITITSNACASGTCALGLAWELIRRGHAERVFAGGYDVLSEMVFSGFDALQALSPTTCRPFDAHRDGLAIGEGAAMLTLETLASARRRNAVILGEITGYATSIDLHHLTQPHPEGNAALETMSLACQSARVTPADVDYLNAHGTGTPLNDVAEAHAISRWAGARAATLPVSSTKAGIGHLLGAAGAVEAIICLMALRDQWLPPQTAFETPDPACLFPIVREPRDARLNVALSNSFGFGGVNATLILRRWA